MTAKVEELKEMIVGLKMQIARGSVPNGHCPYAYHRGFTKPQEPQEDDNCDDCFGCERRFFEQYEAKVREEVEAL